MLPPTRLRPISKAVYDSTCASNDPFLKEKMASNIARI